LKSQKVVETTVRALTYALGGLFILAGVGKAWYLTEFLQTVAALTHLSQSNSQLLALALVICEIAGGAALLARFKLTATSILFCGLIAVFLWMLSLATLEGKEIDCNCFGIFNIRLSDRAELILDIILFNLFALLALLSSQVMPMSRNNKFSFAVLAFLLAYVEYSIFSPIFSHAERRNTANLIPAVSYSDAHHQAFASQKLKNRLMFLVRFSDFNCPPCFESFILLCDSLRARLTDDGQHRLIILFQQDDFADPSNPARLHHWLKANDLRFPVLIIPDSVFKQTTISKSSVAVVNPANETLFLRQLPLEKQEEYQHVLELLMQRS